MKLESALVLVPTVLKLSSGDDERESVFRCETPVVERSAPGYLIAWRGEDRARGVSAHHGMHSADAIFVCGCLLRTTFNEIFDLTLCFFAVVLRWDVTLRRRAIAHRRCRHEVGTAKCLRGGADVGLNSFYAACGCGREYRTPDADAPRSPMVPMVKKSLDPRYVL